MSKLCDDCIICCYEGCNDNKIETCNSLIRFQTPFKQVDNIFVTSRICLTLLVPYRIITGLLFCILGIVLQLLPCFWCKLHTDHVDNKVTFQSCTPVCGLVNCPFMFRDKFQETTTNNDVLETSNQGIGCTLSLSLCHQPRPVGKIERLVKSLSSVTGYNLIISGITKIWNALNDLIGSIICMPCSAFQICKTYGKCSPV